MLNNFFRIMNHSGTTSESSASLSLQDTPLPIREQNCVDFFTNLFLVDAPDGAFIAGGSLRNYFTGESPLKSDIDVFFKSDKDRLSYIIFLESKNAEMLYDNELVTRFKYKYMRIDVIKMYFDSPTACINTFDFTACMIAVDKTRVYLGEHTPTDLAKRQIMINLITFPLSTLSRVIKYTKKGYSICNDELTKVYDACREGEPSESQIIANNQGSFGFAGID